MGAKRGLVTGVAAAIISFWMASVLYDAIGAACQRLPPPGDATVAGMTAWLCSSDGKLAAGLLVNVSFILAAYVTASNLFVLQNELDPVQRQLSKSRLYIGITGLIIVVAGWLLMLFILHMA